MRDNTPKPVKVIPKREKTKAEKEHQRPTKEVLANIKMPSVKQIAFIEKAIKFLPFTLLKYGDDVCLYLDKVIKNPALSLVLKYTAKGIVWASKIYSVKQN